MRIKYLTSVFLLILFSSSSFSQTKSENHELNYLEKNLSLSNIEKEFLLKNDFETKNLYKFSTLNGLNEENNNFIKQIIQALIITKKENYTRENYPGKEDGYPFEWWKDEKWIQENIKL
ncbi:MAG: hypothetical protein V4670_09710 [Bacteroidota bacterium]